MATLSQEFLLDGLSFVTETEDNISTVVRTNTGSAITQKEKDTAGDFFDESKNTIDYAKIYNLDFGSNWIDKMGASDEWMSSALTNKSYKNVFKTATGKSSSNISFASALETNTTWEPSGINKNANGKSTSKGGKFIARYPLNQDRKEYDYLQVTALEYEPAKFNTKNATPDAFGITEEAENRSMNPIGSVFLPMQPGLGESSNVSWNNSTMNFLEAAGANISGGAISGASKRLKESSIPSYVTDG